MCHPHASRSPVTTAAAAAAAVAEGRAPRAGPTAAMVKAAEQWHLRPPLLLLSLSSRRGVSSPLLPGFDAVLQRRRAHSGERGWRLRTTVVAAAVPACGPTATAAAALSRSLAAVVGVAGAWPDRGRGGAHGPP